MREVPDTPTFSSHVAEILYSECVTCHTSDGVAPFALERYEDARDHADRIAQATGEGHMPPWLPEAGGPPLAGERHLSGRDIEILRRWAEAGAPLGDADEVPDPPVRMEGWVLGEPDLILEMPETYLVPAAEGPGGPGHSHEDIFRNFVIPVPVDEVRHVRAVEFQPGASGVVHHAILSVDPTPSSREADARDPEPGFDGMFTGSAARPPGGFFIGWTPGKQPSWNPEGLTWPLEPGADFVIQAHFRPMDEPVEVRSRVGLYFGDQPAERTALLLQLTARTMRIPPGEAEYTVEDAFELPVDVEIVGVYPHAHYLARTIEAHAVLPDGTERTLLHIPDWDFDWQEAYTFKDPVALPSGTQLRMRYVYDNSADNPQNPHDPPREVVYGPNSSDEMAELWLQALPADPADFDTLSDAMIVKQQGDRVAGWRHRVEVDSTDAWAHARLAAAYDERGQTHLAFDHYQRALELDPDIEGAHFGLALIFEQRGEMADALHHYREAVRIAPQEAAARNNLANLLYYEGRFDEAERQYRAAIEADSTHTDAYVNFGNLLRDQDRGDEALELYREAARVAPDLPDVHITLAFNLILLEEPDEAMEHLREVARLAPQAVEPHISAAWMLATHPEPSARRPDHALQLVEAVQGALRGDHPLVLDVLAAAHAAAGRYDAARTTAEEAHRLASAMGETELARQIAERLELYREGRPYVAPVEPPEPLLEGTSGGGRRE